MAGGAGRRPSPLAPRPRPRNVRFLTPCFVIIIAVVVLVSLLVGVVAPRRIRSIPRLHRQPSARPGHDSCAPAIFIRTLVFVIRTTVFVIRLRLGDKCAVGDAVVDDGGAGVAARASDGRGAESPSDPAHTTPGPVDG